MKRIFAIAVSAVALFTGVAFAGPVEFAPKVDRLELQLETPVNSAPGTKWSQNLSLSTDFRINVLDTTIGKFGVEGTPVYDLRDASLNANFGAYYRPIKYVEVYYNHSSNLDMAHLTNGTNTIRGGGFAGARIVVVE